MVVSSAALQICPHCRAIVQTSVCSICGKSTFDAVIAPPPAPKRSRAEFFAHEEVRQVAVGAVVILALVAAIGFALNRSDPAPHANPLPPPASTTTVAPRPTTSEPAPSVAGGARPASGFVPGAPREVGQGLSPWESPPPLDLVGGGLLDPSLDFTTDIGRVDELLTAFPGQFTLASLDPPQLATFGGAVDIELIETTQPFAVRTLILADGTAAGELWLIASSGSPAGDDYLAAARARWDTGTALSQYAPDVGLRLWLLATDDTTNLWVGDVDTRAMIVVRAPLDLTPSALTEVLAPWQRAA
ncbi:MAG: hypothetical protein RIB98_11480 [Acidimicrobiales bacterium]